MIDRLASLGSLTCCVYVKGAPIKDQSSVVVLEVDRSVGVCFDCSSTRVQSRDPFRDHRFASTLRFWSLSPQGVANDFLYMSQIR